MGERPEAAAWGATATIAGDTVPGSEGQKYFNARWYDPETGRFLSEDPVLDGTLWFAYVANNSVTLTDPSGLSVVYKADGTYVGEVDDDIDGVRVQTDDSGLSPASYEATVSDPLTDNQGDVFTERQFQDLLGTMYSEMAVTGYTADEAAGIYSVLENRAADEGTTTYREAQRPGQVNGWQKRGQISSPTVDPEKLREAAEGLIRGVISDTDYSGGAYFWDGADVAITDRNDPLYCEHRDWGFVYADSAHDIYGTGNVTYEKPVVEHWRDAKGNPTGPRGKPYDHKLESTAAYGGTVFWKYTQVFMDAAGNTVYP